MTDSKRRSVDPVWPPNRYDALLATAYQRGWKAAQETEKDGWVKSSRQQDVDIFSKNEPGSSVNSCKGIGIIDHPPDVIAAVFADGTLTTQWDEMFDRGEKLETFDLATDVGFNLYKAPMLVSQRDIVAVGRSYRFDDGTVFNAYISCDHVRAPRSSKWVRGNLECYGLLIEPHGTGSSRVTYVVATNPNGSLPRWVVDQANKSIPLCIAGVRKLLNKPQVLAKVQAAAKAHAAALEKARGGSSGTGGTGTGSSATASGAGDRKEAAAAGAGVAGESKTAAAATGPAYLQEKDSEVEVTEFGPLPPNRFDAVLRKAKMDVIRAFEGKESDGWKFHSRQKEVDIFIKTEMRGGNQCQYMRGVGIVPVPPVRFREVFLAREIKTQWDEMYSHGGVIECIDLSTSISYNALKTVWPVTARDLVVVGRSKKLSDGSLMIWSGQGHHKDAPDPMKGFIRAELLFSGLLMEPLPEDPSSTKVTYVVASDPKGSIPKSLVNAASITQPLIIAAIRKLIAQDPKIFTKIRPDRKTVAFYASQGLSLQPMSVVTKLGEAPAAGSGVGAGAAAAVQQTPEAYHEPRLIPWDFKARSDDNVKRFRATWSIRHGLNSLRTLCRVACQGIGNCCCCRRRPAPVHSDDEEDEESASAQLAATAAAAGKAQLVGVLSVRVVGISGEILSELRHETIRCRLAFGREKQRTDTGITWNQDFSFPVYNPDGLLSISVVTEEKQGLFRVGHAYFTLGSLSTAVKGQGKRAWYKLGTETDISICLETIYQYSRTADFAADFTPYMIRHAKPEKYKQKKGLGGGLGLSSSRSSDSVTSMPRSPSSLQPVAAPRRPAIEQLREQNARTDAALARQPFSARAFVDAGYRLFDVGAPLLRAFALGNDVLTWRDTSKSGFVLVAVLLCCFYPWCLPTLFSAWMLWYMFVAAADDHFKRLFKGTPAWKQERAQRDAAKADWIKVLKQKQRDWGPSEIQRLETIQHQLHWLASKFEDFFGLLHWREHEVSAAIVAYLLLLFTISLTVSTTLVSVFLVSSIALRNTRFMRGFAWIVTRVLAYARRRSEFNGKLLRR